MNKIQLPYDEFVAFILIYASHEDFEFEKSEIDFIKNKVNKDVFDRMIELFNKLGDFERLQLVMDHKSVHINTPEKKDKIMTMLKENFNSDGDFSKLEKTLLNFLDHLI